MLVFQLSIPPQWLVRIVVIGIVCLPDLSLAAYGFKLDGSLDKEAINRAYFEGEFTRILPPLELYRQSFPVYATKEDSIFVYKYLSVIYASDPSTRNRSESCMVQLIKLRPAIELIDLYIPENIALIFRDVKRSYFDQQKYMREHDLLGNQKKDTVSGLFPKNRHAEWVYWAIGGVGTVVILTATYFVFKDDENSTKQSTDFKP